MTEKEVNGQREEGEGERIMRESFGTSEVLPGNKAEQAWKDTDINTRHDTRHIQ